MTPSIMIISTAEIGNTTLIIIILKIMIIGIIAVSIMTPFITITSIIIMA